MKRVFSFQICCLLLLLASSVWAKEVWLELKTPNFQLVGDISEKELTAIGEKLEQFHENFQKTFTKFQFKTPYPSKVLVLNKFLPYLKPNQTFIAADDTNYILIYPEGNYADIFHGYANFLINNNLGLNKTPAWVNHGIAEYFANRANNNDLLISQQNNLSSLQVLFDTDYFTLQSQSEERKRLFKAQSLALLSFLLNEKAAGDFGKIERFLELLQSGKESREALILAFQFDYKNSEKGFKEFLKQPKLVNPTLFKINTELQVSPVSEAKGLAALGEFLFYSNRLKESAEVLGKSLKLEPNSSLGLSTMALLKVKEFYYEEAELLAEKAIKSEPDNFLNHYRYAVVLSKQGMTEYGFVSGYHPVLAEKMRGALKKAIELNPSFVESYVLFAFVNYVRNEQLDESIEFIQKALAVAPQNQKYLLRAAEINLRKENFTDARRDALSVFFTAPNESVKLYAQNTVQRIDSTEFQLNRIRNEKKKYVDEELVSEKPLSEEEIKQLREKAVADQIRAVLKRPKDEEKRIIASLTRIECSKERLFFVFKTPTNLLRLQARSLDEVSLLSFIEEMNNFRLNCGSVNKENYASIIYGGVTKKDNLISIEFVPKGFKLQN